jgi:DNA repair ATPase RecN
MIEGWKRFRLSQKMVVILDTLGMPNVRFDIQVKLSETYYNIGKDEIQFYLRQIKELILGY